MEKQQYLLCWSRVIHIWNENNELRSRIKPMVQSVQANPISSLTFFVMEIAFIYSLA